jgi:hypothetical protein
VRLIILSAAAVVSLALVTLAISRTTDEGLSIKEYDEFHKVLHPLEHEALPKKDFKRIRTNSAELVKKGKAIVELGVPQGTSDANVEEFRKELTKFNDALDKFSADVKNGSDEQLKTSYSAVHDSFEMLAGMLPRK